MNKARPANKSDGAIDICAVSSRAVAKLKKVMASNRGGSRPVRSAIHAGRPAARQTRRG